MIIYLVCASSTLFSPGRGDRRAPAPHAPVEADIAMTTADDKIRHIAKTAQDYYDSDDVFNYYRQVKYRANSSIMRLTELL